MFNHIDVMLVDNNLDIRNLLSKESILHNSSYINATQPKQIGGSTPSLF